MSTTHQNATCTTTATAAAGATARAMPCWPPIHNGAVSTKASSHMASAGAIAAPSTATPTSGPGTAHERSIATFSPVPTAEPPTMAFEQPHDDSAQSAARPRRRPSTAAAVTPARATRWATTTATSATMPHSDMPCR